MDDTETPQRRKKPRKDAVLATRITRATREALERESDATGRSMSEVAERWLDDAANARATFDGLLGGASAAGAIRQLAEFARRVERSIGDPTQNETARVALIVGWNHLLPVVLPVAEQGDELTDLAIKGVELRFRAEDLKAELERWEGPAEVKAAALAASARIREAAGGGIYGEVAAGQVIELLRQVPADMSDYLLIGLEAVERALRDFMAADEVVAKRVERGRQLGEALAQAWAAPGGQGRPSR